MTEDVPDRVPRRVWVIGAAAVTLTVLVTWLLVAVAHVGRDDVAAGTIYQAGNSEQKYAHDTVVQLPDSALEVQVTTPQERLPHDVAAYDIGGRAQLPPVDGRWVGVRWGFPEQTGQDPRDGLIQSDGRSATLAVATGGHTYALQSRAVAGAYCPTTCSVSGQVWLAVAGDGHDLRVEVTFDGVTQSIDGRTGRLAAGRAAGLYTAAAPSSQLQCGTPRIPSGVTADELDCQIAVVRTPWLATRGWAPPGHQWDEVIVSPPDRIHVTRGHAQFTSAYRADTTHYAASGAQLLTVVDHAPADLARSNSSSTSDTTVTLEAPSTGRVTFAVTADYPLSPDADDPVTAATASLTLTWTVTL